MHGIANIPDDPDLAIAAGTRLCVELIEPLQTRFGRIAIRSPTARARSTPMATRMAIPAQATRGTPPAISGICVTATVAWGATACIAIPWFVDRFPAEGDWTKMAWWIHDHLPYSKLWFFPKLWAFNLSWHERPARRIDSYATPKGCLTKPGNGEPCR